MSIRLRRLKKQERSYVSTREGVHIIAERRNTMTTEQKDMIAIVFDMTTGQLRAALYQIAMGDDLKTALDKARAKARGLILPRQEDLFK